MKTYTRKEREKIIKHVLDNDPAFFDDMFELAESSRFLEQCECCYKYFTSDDMHVPDQDDEPLQCKECVKNNVFWDSYEETIKDNYENR